jgi:hypothetical protein
MGWWRERHEDTGVAAIMASSFIVLVLVIVVFFHNRMRMGLVQSAVYLVVDKVVLSGRTFSTNDLT